eukprot:TRINITY_DN3114_c0_g1_i1.p1 TRINITY_DN3114_c0_g1~~TRINITY_DN3114_c0_g1_i1.p1  ORF type:complete len:321 (-),score=55.61 TRINITY_DN3114_c0_g1_i1:5-967(-)
MIEATTSNFASLVLGDAPVLLFCYTVTGTQATICTNLLSLISGVVCEPLVLVGLNMDRFDLANQLGITELPTIFAVYGKQFLDSLSGDTSRQKVEAFVGQFKAHVEGRTPEPQAEVENEASKLLKVAKETLHKGKTEYAIKIYQKIITLNAEAQSNPESERATLFAQAAVKALAGLAACHVAAGNFGAALSSITDLEQQHAEKLSPQSDLLQAVTLVKLLQVSGLTTLPRDPVDALRQKLQVTPKAVALRTALALQLFAEHRVEECITELLKVKHLEASSRGDESIELVLFFLGPAHPVTKQTRGLLAALSAPRPPPPTV